MQEPAPRVVNIINFIRGVEPRREVDLLEPVVQQLRLVNKHDLPATFLIQYDALLDARYVDLLKAELNDKSEIGLWLEVVQPQCEKAGIPWRGRYPWDWHAHVGFTTGYPPAERERLVDVMMDQFKETFGRYPASVGSWFIDAHTLGYLADKYGVKASCNCKDQSGTDGYTLWGGYWNQAYYPSRKNALMPAQHANAQIPIPVFRMLGSDPIYQYDLSLGKASQSVVTLEPVYQKTGGGGSPEWVRWFFDVLTETPCLAFAYTQVGQENSFSWPAMADGLTDQIDLLAGLRQQGKVRVETLAQSAKWFAERYPVTPATAMAALDDWKDEGRRTVWYESRFYRTNLYWEGDSFRIRDIHLFNEEYPERYLTEVVTSNACRYDTLPIIDGFHWSTPESLAGMRLGILGDGGVLTPFRGGEPRVEERGADALTVTWPLTGGGECVIRLDPDSISFVSGRKDWALALAWSSDKDSAVRAVGADYVDYEHNGFSYKLRCQAGACRQAESGRGIIFVPENGTLEFRLGEAK